MYTITIFLKNTSAPPITMVYKTKESFQFAKNKLSGENILVADDYEQEFIAFESVAGIKFESMEESRKLMIEHNAYQQITRTMMEARVADDPRARSRGATLLNPGMPQNFNGR